MNVKDIIAEIRDDNRQIQELAFNLFCRHTVKMALERYETDEARASRSQKSLSSLTDEKLKEEYESYGAEYMSTKKEEWVKRATEQFNNPK